MTDISALTISLQVVAVMAGLVLLLAIVSRLRHALLALAGMVFVSSIGVATTWSGSPIRTWIYPVQASRSALFLGFGVILLLAAIAHSSCMSGRGLRGQGLILLLMGFYAGLLRMVHEAPVSGLQTLAFVALTIVPILLVVQAILDQEHDCLPVVRAIMLANIGWVAAVAIQIVLNPGAFVGGKGSRFIGLSANPQNAGVTLAVLATVALWLLLNDPKRQLRPLWIALFCADVVFLLVTGSRTAAGTFVIGVMIATYGRLGRVIMALPVLLAVLFVALHLASSVFVDFGEAAGRLRSTEDTRSGAWLQMVQEGLEHPWIGIGVYETKTENSYLKAFSSYGVGMLALVLVLVGISARLTWRLFRLRRWLPRERRPPIDLVLSFNGMYFAAAMLEGIMIARVAFSLTLMLIFSVIGLDVLRRETDRIALESADEWDAETAQYAYDDGSAREYLETDCGA